jgi:hypothetical protein
MRLKEEALILQRTLLHVLQLLAVALLILIPVNIVIGRAVILVQQAQDGPKLNVSSKEADFSVPPPISIASVAAAIKKYNIRSDGTVGAIHVSNAKNETLFGSANKGIYDRCTVVVYPMAFRSWSMLAVTLGHEIEAHCHQNFGYFMGAVFMDAATSSVFGFKEQANSMFEAEAYKYESDNAERFGLSEDEAFMAESTYMTLRRTSGVFKFLVD